ncbi:hypothetical protein Hanom_Chr13g01199181 [Helianthus anomalus]
MGVCFSKKIVNHHEVSYRLMEPIHALVQDIPYNFSHYLMKDITSNMWSGRPFVVYPRFMMRVITSQLGFGGIPAWFPRAEVVLQQSIKHTMLIPSAHNTGLETHLWLFTQIIYGEEEIEFD